MGTPQPRPRYARRREVAVPAALLWSLVAAALVGITATAYLLGRLAAGREARQAAEPAAIGGPSVPDAAQPDIGSASPRFPSPTPDLATALPDLAGLDAPVDTASPAPPTPPPAPVGGSSSEGVVSSLRPQVAAYFERIDGLVRGQGLSGDPQTVAQEILTGALGGDTSRLDGLVDMQRSAIGELEDMTPPTPCATHHRRTLALAKRTLVLTEQLREALTNGNVEGLLALETVGREAEREARDLEALDKELRRTYGLPPKAADG